jgi:hypothetical protein
LYIIIRRTDGLILLEGWKLILFFKGIEKLIRVQIVVLASGVILTVHLR